MNEEWIKCPFSRQVNAVYERNGSFAPQMSHGKSEHEPSNMASNGGKGSCDHFVLVFVDFKESESMIV